MTDEDRSDELLDWYAEDDPDGAALLDDVDALPRPLRRLPDEHARVAHTLWIAHTHLMDCWESTPRIAFLSPEPGSGKTRALEVTEPLVPRPVHAVNTTPAYLFRKVSDPDGPAHDPLRRDRHRVRAEGQRQRRHPRHAQRRAPQRRGSRPLRRHAARSSRPKSCPPTAPSRSPDSTTYPTRS